MILELRLLKGYVERKKKHFKFLASLIELIYKNLEIYSGSTHEINDLD